MNKLIPSSSPMKHKYQRVIITDEILKKIDQHKKMGAAALAHLLGVSERCVTKCRKLKG